MSTYRVTFYVKGKRFEVTVPAASQAHAKQVVEAQYPGATSILARAS
ncbi:MAG TPA: hypothetical protein VIM11_09290 [Tepidisphaeraceae bacterium]|jgi:hypothetical protein